MRFDALADGIATIVGGASTGMFMFTVWVAYFMRRLDDDHAQGRRAALYILVGAALVVFMVFWLCVWPWL